MIHQLPEVSPEILALCEQWQLQFMFKGMAAGNSPGLVWANQADQPTSAFIWDTTHSLYLTGDASDAAFNHALREFITDNLLPTAHQRNLGVFKIYTAHADWSAQAAALFQPLDLQPRARALYGFDPGSVIQPMDALPADLRLRPIDAALMNDASQPDIGAVLEEISSCWTTLDRFLAHGFGFCLLNEANQAVGWCTAEYVSNGINGVGIEVLEAYQRRGLATQLARAFSQHAANHHLKLYWDAWLTNTPSIRVAEKVGFQKIMDYSVYMARLDT